MAPPHGTTQYPEQAGARVQLSDKLAPTQYFVKEMRCRAPRLNMYLVSLQKLLSTMDADAGEIPVHGSMECYICMRGPLLQWTCQIMALWQAGLPSGMNGSMQYRPTTGEILFP